MPLETVFLDAGGVLLFPNWFRISEALARHGVSVDPKALSTAEPHAKRRIDTRTTIQVTHDASRGWMYFNLILAEAGVEVTDAARQAMEELHEYHKRANLWDVVPDDVLPALKALRARGLRLTVVSNANGTLGSLLDRLGLAGCFDCVLDSHDVGVEKPDPRLFEIALARSGARAETTIHVGDLYEVDIVGARSAGIRGVLLDQAGLYKADCPTVKSLDDLIRKIDAGQFDGARPVTGEERRGENQQEEGRKGEP